MGFLRKFMYGRYGGDQLGHVTLTLYRMLSRNIPKRRAENQKFLEVTAPIRNWWRSLNLRRTDKAHKYFRCPACGQQLRVPRGAGRLRVTCRACGASFEENS